MTAAVSNITIEQGATYRRKLTLKDVNEAPINITGYTFRGAIKTKPGTPVLATFTFTDDAGSGDPQDDADPAAGEIYMLLTGAQSALLPLTGYTTLNPILYFKYDVEMVDTNDNIFRIMNGTVVLSPEITT
jgi:hypothetical protein